MTAGRRSTFSHWSHSQITADRMIEAGFFGCNKGDRVICLYCKVICHCWDSHLDDPCEVHQLLSPNCSFVKSMSCWHSSQYNRIRTTLPFHYDYVLPENRLKTFSTWTESQFPRVEKFVDAGFFYINEKLVCFYCNGSLDGWQANHHHPVAEHTRQFPSCNYARQLCGEQSYRQIQQLKYSQGLKARPELQ